MHFINIWRELRCTRPQRANSLIAKIDIDRMNGNTNWATTMAIIQHCFCVKQISRIPIWTPPQDMRNAFERVAYLVINCKLLITVISIAMQSVNIIWCGIGPIFAPRTPYGYLDYSNWTINEHCEYVIYHSLNKCKGHSNICRAIFAWNVVFSHIWVDWANAHWPFLI